MAGKFTEEGIGRLIASYLPFVPTHGQAELVKELASFVFQFRSDVGFVLQGYAGTGKTSVVAALVRALPVLNITPVLLAPTGRAAKVLSHYSGTAAGTIHKQIYYAEPDEEGRVQLSLRQNRARNTLYVVDEASMIGEEESLLYDFFRYVGAGYRCRVLLVGDTAQLPPVGSPYSPALDLDYLSSCFPLHFLSYTLEEVVRQGEGSLVLENATALRGKVAREDPALPLFSFGYPHGKTDLKRLEGEALEDVLQTEYGKREREEVVFITRSNKRANLFNNELRGRVFGMDSDLAAGELLMVVRNNYFWLPSDSKAGFIANGDMMEVLRIRKREEIYGFHFADIEARLVDYPEQPPLMLKLWLDALHVDAASMPYEEVRKLFGAVWEDYAHLTSKSKRMQAVRQDPYFNALQVKYAYALTCHKTQGGQWPCVFVDAGYLTEDVLDTEYLRWLYTALTRATEVVYLSGFPEKCFR